MKLAKLTGVTTIEAAGLVTILGGQKLLYRDVPLLDSSQIGNVIEEVAKEKPDSIMFDTGAIFDRAAYELARDCVDAIKEKHELKVVIFNAPDYGRKTSNG